MSDSHSNNNKRRLDSGPNRITTNDIEGIVPIIPIAVIKDIIDEPAMTHYTKNTLPPSLMR